MLVPHFLLLYIFLPVKWGIHLLNKLLIFDYILYVDILFFFYLLNLLDREDYLYYKYANNFKSS
jgi:hypothetical protein